MYKKPIKTISLRDQTNYLDTNRVTNDNRATLLGLNDPTPIMRSSLKNNAPTKKQLSLNYESIAQLDPLTKQDNIYIDSGEPPRVIYSIQGIKNTNKRQLFVSEPIQTTEDIISQIEIGRPACKPASTTINGPIDMKRNFNDMRRLKFLEKQKQMREQTAQMYERAMYNKSLNQ